MLIEKYRLEKIDITFCCDALVEMVASLHVISNPSHHHTLKEWVERKIKKMDSELLQSIYYIGEHFDDWTLIFYLVTGETAFDGPIKEELIDHIINLPDLEFSSSFFAELIDEGKIREILSKGIIDDEAVDLSKVRKYISKEDIELYFANIQHIKDELKYVFDSYWSTIFQDEWDRIKLYERESFTNDLKIIKVYGWRKYISTLHKDIYIKNDTIVFNRKEDTIVIELRDIDEIVIIPSVFLNPHLMLTKKGRMLAIYKNLPYQRFKKDDLFNKVEKVAKALASDARLQIIVSLRDENLSTKDLSEQLHLTQSTISGHLKLLKEAKLISSYRKGSFVFYKLNTKRIQQFIEDFSLLSELSSDM